MTALATAGADGEPLGQMGRGEVVQQPRAGRFAPPVRRRGEHVDRRRGGEDAGEGGGDGSGIAGQVEHRPDAVCGHRREEPFEVHPDDEVLPGVRRRAGHRRPAAAEPVSRLVHRERVEHVPADAALELGETWFRLFQQADPPVAVRIHRYR